MHSNQRFQIRSARPQDVEQAIPLIYCSGMQAIDYCFQCFGKRSDDFLRFAFTDGVGFLGYKNHTVATLNDDVVGILASYNLSTYVVLTIGHLWQLWRFYPASRFFDLLIRGVHLQSVMKPPNRTDHYVAHFGVAQGLRGKGIGLQLLKAQHQTALALGRTTCSLDVSDDNPRAQALYERFGFSVTSENRFSGPPGAVPDTRRMSMPVRTA